MKAAVTEPAAVPKQSTTKNYFNKTPDRLCKIADEESHSKSSQFTRTGRVMCHGAAAGNEPTVVVVVASFLFTNNHNYAQHRKRHSGAIYQSAAALADQKAVGVVVGLVEMSALMKHIARHYHCV